MNSIILMIYLTAVHQGIDPRLALSVAYNESSLRPNAVGLKDDIGLFQIRHTLVPESKKELMNAEINTLVAIRILKEVKKECENSLGQYWISCYNRGIAGGKKLRRPASDAYYLKVSKTYKCLKPYHYLDFMSRAVNKCFK